MTKNSQKVWICSNISTFFVGFLTLCVVSIFLEGSPFDPDYFNHVKDIQDVKNTTDAIINQEALKNCNHTSYLSVTVLLTGIIVSRFGLWVSDLTITQLLQENVKEEHRGVIGGVQNGLNEVMNTIKFLLVICLPETATFGYLVIASYSAICLGGISYTSFVFQSRKSQNKVHSDYQYHLVSDL